MTGWKIAPERVPSDDCAIYMGRQIADSKIVEQGTPHYIHVGEWIEVVRVDSIAQMMAVADLTSQAVERMGPAIASIATQIAERVTAWNWTDLQGNPLEQPYQRPDIIQSLSTDEFAYLRAIIAGESPGERKNGLKPSAIASSPGAASRKKRS